MASEKEKKLFPAQKVESFCSQVLTKAGLSSESADIVTKSLMCAELRGVYSHGVVRLETYLQRIEKGIMKLSAPITTEMDAPGVALLNANNTFGQVAGYKAMQLAIEKAKTCGNGVVCVKNSNHFGVAAFYAGMAVEANMVGWVFTHSSPAMAVFGTKTPLIGTNPIAIAIPAGKHLPIVLDMSTSVVARGKIRYSALTGQSIPLGWARDPEGNPTQDANLALKGTLEPVGGPKGSGLSLIIDILSGVLTNTVLTGGVKTVTDMSGPGRTGHFFMALDISKFIDPDLFKANLDKVITDIKALPPVNEGGKVFMPGEIELLAEIKRREEGTPLDKEVVDMLNGVAARYGAAPLT
ncbi:MAG: Ldh family oxidoreductase [Deltaproteobacteria bacterium]|nr:Ldh family oxidoreductase [Deltaproteobacteria bacterium]